MTRGSVGDPLNDTSHSTSLRRLLHGLTHRLLVRRPRLMWSSQAHWRHAASGMAIPGASEPSPWWDAQRLRSDTQLVLLVSPMVKGGRGFNEVQHLFRSLLHLPKDAACPSRCRHGPDVFPIVQARRPDHDVQNDVLSWCLLSSATGQWHRLLWSLERVPTSRQTSPRLSCTTQVCARRFAGRRLCSPRANGILLMTVRQTLVAIVEVSWFAPFRSPRKSRAG